MKNPIYLDYNATTPIDKEVAAVMIEYIQTHFGNPSSSYEIGKHSKEAINHARKQVADLINARPDEILFTSCATESNNLAIRGIALQNQHKGKHIITSSIEHPAVIEVCKYLASMGFEITYLPVDNSGKVNPKDAEKEIRIDTILISIMHSNNEVGTIQPIAEIAELAKQNGVIFHTDAAQSVGKIEVNVQDVDIDLLTIAGHKLYAPKGIGALYIKKETHLRNILFGAGQENGLRPGTENLVHIVALGKACEIAKRDFNRNFDHMLACKTYLLNGLRNMIGEKLHVNGDLSNCLPNTLSVAFEGVDSHVLASEIGKDVYISTGSACHADVLEISSVLKAMKISPAIGAATVRISTGKYTTFEEIDRAVEIISKTVLNIN